MGSGAYSLAITTKPIKLRNDENEERLRAMMSTVRGPNGASLCKQQGPHALRRTGDQAYRAISTG